MSSGLLLAMLIVTCQSSLPALASPSASVATVAPSQQSSLLPTPSAAPPTASSSTAAVTAFPLGPLRGQIAWVSRTLPIVTPATPPPSGARAVVSYELWALPLDGSAPRLAVRYRSAFTARFNLDQRDTNILRRQFSTDGRRVVLSVATSDDGTSQELRVIDLEAGAVAIPLPQSFPTATRLDVNPAWSPDGAHIAFVRLSVTGTAGELWVSNPDGGAAKVIWTGCNACQPSSPLIHRASAPPRIYGWLPDSQHIGFDPVNFEHGYYATIDLNGATTEPAAFFVNTVDPASWRNLAFAVSTEGGNGSGRTQILVSENPQQRYPQIVADVTVNPNDNNVTGVHDPRWDPKGEPLLIYTEYGIEASFVIVDLGARTTKKVSGRVTYADWMPNGDGIITLEEHPSTAPKSVNVYERDGRIRTSGLFLDSTNTNYTVTDITARSY